MFICVWNRGLRVTSGGAPVYSGGRAPVGPHLRWPPESAGLAEAQAVRARFLRRRQASAGASNHISAPPLYPAEALPAGAAPCGPARRQTAEVRLSCRGWLRQSRVPGTQLGHAKLSPCPQLEGRIAFCQHLCPSAWLGFAPPSEFVWEQGRQFAKVMKHVSHSKFSVPRRGLEAAQMPVRCQSGSAAQSGPSAP